MRRVVLLAATAAASRFCKDFHTPHPETLYKLLRTVPEHVLAVRAGRRHELELRKHAVEFVLVQMALDHVGDVRVPREQSDDLRSTVPLQSLLISPRSVERLNLLRPISPNKLALAPVTATPHTANTPSASLLASGL